MMPSIEIYTKDTCPYCHIAKAILREHGAHYSEYSLTALPGLFPVMRQRAEGRVTVPQIFIDGVPIGGADDLARLKRQGRLSPLLGK